MERAIQPVADGDARVTSILGLRARLWFYFVLPSVHGAACLMAGLRALPSPESWFLIALGFAFFACVVGVWNAREWARLGCGILYTFWGGYCLAVALSGGTSNGLGIAYLVPGGNWGVSTHDWNRVIFCGTFAAMYFLNRNFFSRVRGEMTRARAVPG